MVHYAHMHSLVCAYHHSKISLCPVSPSPSPCRSIVWHLRTILSLRGFLRHKFGKTGGDCIEIAIYARNESTANLVDFQLIFPELTGFLYSRGYKGAMVSASYLEVQ